MVSVTEREEARGVAPVVWATPFCAHSNFLCQSGARVFRSSVHTARLMRLLASATTLLGWLGEVFALVSSVWSCFCLVVLWIRCVHARAAGFRRGRCLLPLYRERMGLAGGASAFGGVAFGGVASKSRRDGRSNPINRVDCTLEPETRASDCDDEFECALTAVRVRWVWVFIRVLVRCRGLSCRVWGLVRRQGSRWVEGQRRPGLSTVWGLGGGIPTPCARRHART